VVCLYAHQQPNNELNETKTQKLLHTKTNNVILPDVEPGVFFADLFGLAIACELLGLLDVVVNDPSFYKNGGWFQPIPAVPSTLSILVQRFSLNSVLYIGTVLLLMGGVGKEDVSSPQTVLQTSLRTSFVFTMVRLIVGAMLAFTTASKGGLDSNFDIVEMLRECYFVALATTAGRYVVYGLFYR
jgi:hypothetical protein